MRDNVLIALFRQILIDGMAAVSLPALPVRQSYQPTQQGVPSEACLFLHKIGDERIGSVARETKYDTPTGTMTVTETQQYATTFQVSALAAQTAQDTTASLTASDIANGAAAILQGDPCLATLHAQDIGIQRIGQLRNMYFMNDRNQSEAYPSFDFVVTHKQVIVRTQPFVVSIDFQILPV